MKHCENQCGVRTKPEKKINQINRDEETELHRLKKVPVLLNVESRLDRLRTAEHRDADPDFHDLPLKSVKTA